MIPIEVVYADRSLGAGAAGYGALVAAWGGGILVGGFAFAALRHRRLLVLAAGATCLIGCSYLGLAVATALVPACLIAFAGGTGNGIQWVAVITALQESVPDEFQARVVGLLDSAATLAPVFAYTLGGVLAQTLSPRAAYAVAGAGTFLCAIAMAREAVRRLDPGRHNSAAIRAAALAAPSRSTGRYWAVLECQQVRAVTDVALIRQDWHRLSPGLSSHAIENGWWEPIAGGRRGVRISIDNRAPILSRPSMIRSCPRPIASPTRQR